jgi:hypothetical protein
MESTIYLDEQDKKESKKQGLVLQSQVMGLTVRNSLEDNFLKEIQTRKEANKQISSLNMHARRLKQKNNTTSIGFSNG